MCATRAPFVARSPETRRSIEARAAIVDEWRSTLHVDEWRSTLRDGARDERLNV